MIKIDFLQTIFGSSEIADNSNLTVKVFTYSPDELTPYDTLNELFEENIPTALPLFSHVALLRAQATIAKESRRGMVNCMIGPSLANPPFIVEWFMNGHPAFSVEGNKSLVHWYLFYRGEHPADTPFVLFRDKYYANPQINLWAKRVVFS